MNRGFIDSAGQKKTAVTSHTPMVFIFVVIAMFSITIVGAWPADSMPLPAQAGGGDAGHGKEVYEKYCQKCHALDEDKDGPKLRGIYGSKAGTISRFNYSGELKASKVTWDAGSLDKWLTDSDAFIADTDMQLKIRNPSDRADIIAYLRALPPK